MGEIFERVLPGNAMEWTGERLTTATAGQVEIEHLHRYFLARHLCRGQDVLDVASGEGYGSALLAQTARSVIGVELSEQTVAHATAAYTASNLRFKQGDARTIPVENGSIDVVVSFETLEHFFEHECFIAEVRRVLRPGGRLILSSPERDIYSPLGSAANPYHARELTRGEFEILVRSAFAHVQILLQRPMIGSALVVDEMAGPSETLTFEKRGTNHYEVNHGLPRPPYIIAIASDAPLPAIANSLFIETSEVGDILNRAAAGPVFDPAVIQRAEIAEAAHHTARLELALSIAQAREMQATANLEIQRASEATTLLMARVEKAEGETRLAALSSLALQAQRDALRSVLRRNTAAERARLAELEAEAAEWQRRYYGLRGRLSGILDRLGYRHVARLVSPNLRRLIRERVFSAGKRS